MEEFTEREKAIIIRALEGVSLQATVETFPQLQKFVEEIKAIEAKILESMKKEGSNTL